MHTKCFGPVSVTVSVTVRVKLELEVVTFLHFSFGIFSGIRAESQTKCQMKNAIIL